MTSLSTIARENALSCEAKKHAYRQTQDGVVVSFVLHPQEVPEQLALASLGTRFLLALVELNDDETPKQKGAADQPPPPVAAPRGAASDGRQAAPRPFTSMPLPQQAALLCQDPVFRSFIREEWDLDCDCETDAIETLYGRYGISSRRQIEADSIVGRHFVADREQFIAWKQVAA